VRWVPGAGGGGAKGNPTDDKPRLEILRPGAISRQQLAAALKELAHPVELVTAASTVAPGHLANHYQPTIPLALAATAASAAAREKIAASLGLNPTLLWDLQLSPDARLAARELYEKLRRLSEHRRGAIVFWVTPEWESEAWEALRDRMTRAASSVFEAREF
jgi:L-threonylcarbamoyladenylate synthase